jgi:hypothetical protein
MIHLLQQVLSTCLERWMRSPLRWICSAIASNLRLSLVTRPSIVEAPSPGDIWHSCGPTKLMLSSTGRNSATHQGNSISSENVSPNLSKCQNRNHIPATSGVCVNSTGSVGGTACVALLGCRTSSSAWCSKDYITFKKFDVSILR